MKILDDIGVMIPEIYLPRPEIDLKKWAVIACDQFTSEPEYWRDVERTVGDAPSTLNLTFPEIHLEAPDKDQRIQKIQATMRKYLSDGSLQPVEGMLYVERRVEGRLRRGLLLALDLERYDYNKGSASLIRATEGTIVERLPPRMRIREGAALELPHILVLIDDPGRTVIEPITDDKPSLHKRYDFDLMLDSGHLTGFTLDSAGEQRVINALRSLASPQTFSAKYGVGANEPVLLFAMGDGNHSLATAKAVWEKIKPQAGMDHPARYALVEVENVHDDGLNFAPIHRVLFHVQRDLMTSLKSAFGSDFSYSAVGTAQDVAHGVERGAGSNQAVGLIQSGSGPKFGVIEIAHAPSNLAVGTLQAFLDAFVKEGGVERIDYVHGGEVAVRLGSESGNAAFYLPTMSKSALFKTVILDGELPRKTFSMGEAREKRFYMEARKIA